MTSELPCHPRASEPCDGACGACQLKPLSRPPLKHAPREALRTPPAGLPVSGRAHPWTHRRSDTPAPMTELLDGCGGSRCNSHPPCCWPSPAVCRQSHVATSRVLQARRSACASGFHAQAGHPLGARPATGTARPAPRGPGGDGDSSPAGKAAVETAPDKVLSVGFLRTPHGAGWPLGQRAGSPH